MLTESGFMGMMNTKTALKDAGSMEITGDDQQILTIALNPDEEILVQPGCMVWSDEGITSFVSAGGCRNFCTRLCCFGQSGFRVHWRNDVDRVQRIGLTPSFPAKVVPVNLDKHSGELFIKRGAFLAATDHELMFQVESAGRRSGGTVSKGLLGGQGFLLTKVTGEGWVFLSAAGAIFERKLNEGETVIVDSHSVVAWETTVHFGYRRAGDVGMMCCGGEGMTNTTLTGPGYVIVQSMPFEKVRAMMATGDGNASGGDNPLAGLIACVMLLLLGVVMVVAVVLSADADDKHAKMQVATRHLRG